MSFIAIDFFLFLNPYIRICIAREDGGSVLFPVADVMSLLHPKKSTVSLSGSISQDVNIHL